MCKTMDILKDYLLLRFHNVNDTAIIIKSVQFVHKTVITLLVYQLVMKSYL